MGGGFDFFGTRSNRILVVFKQIYVTYGTLTATTTPAQSGPGSNGNKRVLDTPPNLLNWSLTIRFSLVSNQENSSVGSLTHPCKGYSQRILWSFDRERITSKLTSDIALLFHNKTMNLDNTLIFAEDEDSPSPAKETALN